MPVETKIHPSVTPEDMQFLRQSEGVTGPTILKFLTAGVDDEDIQDVLDMRNKLSIPKKKGGQNGVTVDAMIEAYTACGGDMDALEEIVEKADVLAYTKKPTNFDRGLRQAVRLWQEGKLE